jgi:hypothetical protein
MTSYKVVVFEQRDGEAEWKPIIESQDTPSPHYLFEELGKMVDRFVSYLHHELEILRNACGE